MVSGGSTPTAGHWQPGPVNELRPGVYVFNDAQQLAIGTCTAADLALSAASTVIGVPAPNRFVLDAGSKVLGPDRSPWVTGHGYLPAHPDATITALWEHHAVVQLPEGVRGPRLGEVVSVVPNHVCTPVNLADRDFSYFANSTKSVHAVGERATWGPRGFLESRMWMAVGQVATSTQSPWLPLLYVDLRQARATSTQSPSPLLL